MNNIFKRVLIVATVPSMIGQFNMNNISILLKLGYQVDVGADFTDTSVWPTERIEIFKEELNSLGVNCYQLDFSRSPLSLKRHFSSYKQIYKLIKEREYSFIHTHTPIASALVRIAAKKAKVKVIYTAHGFHFYKGAPIKNWLLYYPIEKMLSKYTDVLITINKEDYLRAKNKFNAKRIMYIPGVGVDTVKFSPRLSQRDKIRNELGINEKSIMLLSVGELNANKNHESVIRSLYSFDDLVYVIVGKGDKSDELKRIASSCSVNLRLVGYRSDVSDFYNAADVYVLPSIREGLNVSLMEAMASGLSVACSRIRGNIDLIDDNRLLFNPKDFNEINSSISYAIANRKEFGKRNNEIIKNYSKDCVVNLTEDLYINI